MVLSSLGFYLIAPASDTYQLGSPAVRSTSIQLENGKVFEIEALNQSDQNVYVQKITLNRKSLKEPLLPDKALIVSGKIVFVIDSKPHKSFN